MLLNRTPNILERVQNLRSAIQNSEAATVEAINELAGTSAALHPSSEPTVSDQPSAQWDNWSQWSQFNQFSN
jgi:hypothetical protein